MCQKYHTDILIFLLQNLSFLIKGEGVSENASCGLCTQQRQVRNPLLSSDENEGMVMYRKLKSLNEKAFEINLLILHV